MSIDLALRRVVFEPTIDGISGTIAEANFLMVMLAAFTLAFLRLGWALFVGTGIISVYAIAAANLGAG